ncbi:autotransporter outer membrane beta-barrel domain-containing protein [Dongia sedimenti]|uniref:Autotransporter domain-containing protein n=1 Tax=Dongia sedimenti TaxID=3064282 RepID=A0ABU0YPG4_9PROT|nr:autotransporter domain-containing protein [Rhodospirillaceae bacterium R-7]
MLFASAIATGMLLRIGAAQAEDVNIAASTNDGVNLDGFAGTTASIAPGVTVNNTNGNANCSSSTSVCASTKAWTLTNQGTIGPNPTGNGVRFTFGGALVNSGSVSNANISITGGTGAVTNQAGASITSTTNGINIATSGAQFIGTVSNAGTITGTGSGDLVALFGGGSVTNLATGTISANNSSNAVSISGGTTRTVTNSGTITNTGPSFATGILIQGAGATNTVTNNAGAQIDGGFNGIFTSSTAVLSLDNAGSITSTRGSAVEATLGGTLTNSGTIASTNSNGILTRNTAAAEVINSGTITGAVNAINFTNAGGGAVGATHTVRLRTGSVLNGNVLGGTATDNLILEGTGTESIAKFSNFETLSMTGSDWTLTNTGTFSTSAAVQSGMLHVNGTLTSPAVTMAVGGTLAGTGTIIGTVINNGNVAPGNSIGTLNITGPYTQAGGSTLTVEVDSGGASDLLAVTGAATIQPNATVSVLAAPGTYTVGTRSTILTASGGVTGTYDTLTDNAAFVDFALAYDANNVFLDVLTSSVAFASVAETPNQAAAGGAVDSLDAGNGVKTAVFGLTEAQAREAFDLLSGEIYASTKGLLFTQSESLRNALDDRLLQPGGAEATSVGTSQLTFSFAPGGASCTAASCAMNAAPVLTAWARALGSWGSADGDGNAGSARSETAGMLAGADATFDERWRIGIAAGYSHTGVDVDSRASTASIDSYHLAAYGGFYQGPFSAHLGATYSFHDIDTERHVEFPGFSERVDADAAARSAQAFGEIGYDIHLGAAMIQPTAGLSYVNIDSDHFDEGDGAAALRAGDESDDLLFSSIGFRAAMVTQAFNMPLRLHGMLGWRHAYGDTTLESRLEFSDGSSAFTVSGTPIARNAALIEAGADLDLTGNLTVGLSYAGQIAADSRENAVRADARLRF